MSFERSKRGASWLLNLEGEPGSVANVPEWFGFTKYGGNWSFLGARLGALPDNVAGRWWIPDMADTAAKAGRYGTGAEAWSAAKTAWGAGRKSMFMRYAGRAFLPAFTLYGLAQGESVGDIAKNALAMRFLAPVARAMFLNPVGAAITATVGLGVGVGAAYIAYRNDMREFGKEAKKTEFLGDMSAFQTMPAATMRQRSMQAIQRSFLNARRSLGHEARFYNMPKSMSMYGNPALYGL